MVSVCLQVSGSFVNTFVVKVMQHHRFTAKIPLSAASYPILNRVPEEENLKVMVFCVNDGPGPQDIAFPHQCELKVNSFEIKANLRGLKNKPGSTRPADITKDLRFTPVNYNGNYVELTYALTSKVNDKVQSISIHNPTRFAFLALGIYLSRRREQPKANQLAEILAGCQRRADDTC